MAPRNSYLDIPSSEWQSLSQDFHSRSTSSKISTSEEDYFQNLDIERVSVCRGPRQNGGISKCNCAISKASGYCEQSTNPKSRRKKKRNESTETPRFNIRKIRPNAALQHALQILFREIAKMTAPKRPMISKPQEKKKCSGRRDTKNYQYKSCGTDVSFRVNDNIKVTIKGPGKASKSNFVKKSATPPKPKVRPTKQMPKTSLQSPMGTDSEMTYMKCCPMFKFNGHKQSFPRIFNNTPQQQAKVEEFAYDQNPDKFEPNNPCSCGLSCPLLKDKMTQYEPSNIAKRSNIKVTLNRGKDFEEVEPQIIRDGKKMKVIIKLNGAKTSRESRETLSNIDSSWSSVSQMTNNSNISVQSSGKFRRAHSSFVDTEQETEAESRKSSISSIRSRKLSAMTQARETCSKATCKSNESLLKPRPDISTILSPRRISCSCSRMHVDHKDDFHNLQKYWQEIEAMLNRRLKQLKPICKPSNINISIGSKTLQKKKLKSTATKTEHESQNVPSFLVIKYPNEKRNPRAIPKSDSKKLRSSLSRRSSSCVKNTPNAAPQVKSSTKTAHKTPVKTTPSSAILDRRIIYCKHLCPACQKPSSRNIDNSNSGIPVQTDLQLPTSLVIYLEDLPTRSKSTERNRCDRKRCVSFSNLPTSKSSSIHPKRNCECATETDEPQIIKTESSMISEDTQTITSRLAEADTSNSQLTISTPNVSESSIGIERISTNETANSTDSMDIKSVSGGEKTNEGDITGILNDMSIPDELINDVLQANSETVESEVIDNKETQD